MCDGLGFGDNAKAALITRGLNEITKLGTTMGCKAETFYGLTGIGDIVVTATSKHSRNHNAGVLLAQGYNLEQTLEKIGMVVEGINALVAAQQLSEKYNIELPIVNAVYAVAYKGAKPTDVVNKLFLRKTKSE
jgi:glycerol-3-phosphate dehydrogenase (NAD(P)+)